MTTPVGVSATSHVNASSQRSNTTLMRMYVSIINNKKYLIEKRVYEKSYKKISISRVLSDLGGLFFDIFAIF